MFNVSNVLFNATFANDGIFVHVLYLCRKRAATYQTITDRRLPFSSNFSCLEIRKRTRITQYYNFVVRKFWNYFRHLSYPTFLVYTYITPPLNIYLPEGLQIFLSCIHRRVINRKHACGFTRLYCSKYVLTWSVWLFSQQEIQE